jgi:2-polyprenyl-3-methyl-5-hydroxy-6-metoxy-1,4-benzoquinol methylase
MDYLENLKLSKTANIIDIGGGDVVDALLDKGYQNIWVLDISEFALERAKKKRLGDKVHLDYMGSFGYNKQTEVKFDLAR